MFGGNTSSTFGSASNPSIFGSSTPAFGASPTPAFGASSTPAFGASSSTPAFGASTSPSLFGSTTSAFGASSTPSLFGASSTPTATTPAFGATSTSAFGLSSTPAFGTSPTPLFGGSSAPAFGASPTPSTPSIFGAGSSSSLFGNVSTPSLLGSAPQSSGLFGGASQSAFGQPGFGQTPATSFGQTSLFGQTQASPFGGTHSPFGQSTPGFGQTQLTTFATPQQTLLQSGQLTTQMAPVAPMSMPLPDRELQAIIDAYKDDPGNSRFAFKHLLLSVTDPSLRIKPVGISDIMWAEAMSKLEGMERSERERLWPELMQGFKDLSRRLKLQDEALAADAQRLQATQTNVKLLQRHFEADTIPWLQRLRQKEQELQRKLLKMMRIVEALEGKGFRIPLTKGEAQLGARLRTLMQQLQGPRAELPKRVDALLSSSRMQASTGGISHRVLLGSGKIDEQSLAEMHKVLQEQTNAIAHLVKVVKRDMRDMEIIVSDASDNQKSDNDLRRKALGYSQSDVYMKPITF